MRTAEIKNFAYPVYRLSIKQHSKEASMSDEQKSRFLIIESVI